jgi:glycerol-3-phosphate acyltransferase PlsX
MGSDAGPGPVVRAAAALSRSEQSPRLILVGPEQELSGLLGEAPHDPSKIELRHAPDYVSMEDKPAEAFEAKPQASIAVAARLLAEDGADALVSAGNTGAVLLAGARHVGRLEGVKRAALAAVYPTERPHGEKRDPFALMLDVGATLDAGAEELVTFAIMGSAYASLISENPSPKVALLSNGSEPYKGSAAIVEAHRVLVERGVVNFIGNLEGIDIPKGTADVIVTGGFVGNVVLKMLEGVSETVRDLARYAYRRRLAWKLGLWMLASGIRRLKEFTDWQQYGGAPILGLNKVCIKAHGRSSERAVGNAIKVATKAVRSDLNGVISRGLARVNRC